MLVLMRRPNESIQIGDNITVTVVQIRRNQVRLGIKAPPDVDISRTEPPTEPQPKPTREGER